ncbi:MAG: hypothetical protein M3483_05115, partial [Gemmatimonadota bacterium]|nr:hypothetical protein [Gemmatimonadota bacterium]
MNGRGPLLGLWLAMGACAHIEAPTGGPEDKTPPQLIVTRPDTSSRVESFSGPAVLVFDERLSERDVAGAVTVSPRTSGVRVDHSGDELRVSLQRGWEPGRIYQIAVQPTV